ncbi:cytochrome P450 2C25-like [Eublepharis macularius]|uniref:Cytochrome P450 2C25-like n=1 Tax=Eublepharis macularius TaxID=481883 RepID=A0AA97L1C0_EUBMA|nr:cytochrome P450 2C25-like [Eublepharis macularius]
MTSSGDGSDGGLGLGPCPRQVVTPVHTVRIITRMPLLGRRWCVGQITIIITQVVQRRRQPEPDPSFGPCQPNQMSSDPTERPSSERGRCASTQQASEPMESEPMADPMTAKTYGSIFTIWAGCQPLVILSGFEAVKEGLVKHSEMLSGRLVTPFYKAVTKEKGIIFSNGHTWKQQRKFVIVTLRKLGLGKKGVENQIQEEAKQLVETFARANGQPIDPSLPITNSVSNVICALVFGHRYSVDDEDFLKLMKAIETGVTFGGSFFHLLYEGIPWLMKHISWPYKKAFGAVDVVLSYARKETEKHRRQLAEHDPRDFIDYYLLQMEKSKNDPTSTYDDENLAQCISDLFIAGSDTSSYTLLWALLLVMTHPDIQEKIQKEIEDAFGSSQLIGYQGRKNVPYTFAAIHEIQRFKCILSAGNPRVSVQDGNVLGSFIPKGTTVVPDIPSVCYDPKLWETPQKFNPNHFLDKNGHFVDREEFLLFSAGARVCPGKELAKMELFIFLTNLLRAFTFKLPEGVTEVNTEPVLGLTMPPHHYKLCAIPRLSNS